MRADQPAALDPLSPTFVVSAVRGFGTERRKFLAVLQVGLSSFWLGLSCFLQIPNTFILIIPIFEDCRSW